MKVLVTGGGGFLGSSVVRGLAAAGHEVVSTDLRPPSVVMDVTSAEQVSQVISAERPEVVVHLASIVTPGPGSTRELEHAVDVTGTRHVLDACVAAGVRRVVVSSSGAAYGYHADNPAWITEDQPVRGNEEFAYSHHKRLVEEMLASYPSLEQVVLRIGTILGRSVDNQITALFERRRLLRIRGSESPFVFIWDEDVVAIIQRAVTGSVTGVFNVAGDGALTITEIAGLLGKPVLTVPEPVLRGALAVASRVGLSPYGPEQTRFLQYRPVLDNTRLKAVFGYTPTRTSREAFDEWRAARRSS
ncbi:NAD-dependent epimerase/dehydratase family protein [Nocardioides sp. zg-1228]|uniref:NAD-dependent epimerase/dehydratase family protein n=1 Tax=Nocardioides sp. zg-1228 TaxID=2763008 RepID=UPI0016427B40|nr:NAD-dependent epimerase/dehydratase family protein [Nocardioides sp. zg-1228]MBC2933035.1 NAD-dependent epimerase/dehydratase family protein [Nocardioides sp. zg-1228]QSF56771.1 NAD-dependent epimerase/dehydratase family protein [Nocardioides sp. zg-1228]